MEKNVISKIDTMLSKIKYKYVYVEIETESDKFIIEKTNNAQIGFKKQDKK